MSLFTDHEIVNCISEKVTSVIHVCNGNFGFIRTQIPCHIGSEDRRHRFHMFFEIDVLKT